MTNLEEIRDRLEDAEQRVFGEPGTGTVVVLPTGAHGTENAAPPTDDIYVDDKETGTESVAVPHHLPRSMNGVVCLTETEVADVWRSMPADVRAAERELRGETGDPIPAVLEGAT